MHQVLRQVEGLEAFRGVSFGPMILEELPLVGFEGDTIVPIRALWIGTCGRDDEQFLLSGTTRS